jgi:glutamine synthetase
MAKNAQVTYADVLNKIKADGIEFVEFRFTDTLGKVHRITHHASVVSENTLLSGVGFDGSSIAGWKEINDSDMVLRPDLTTAFTDPFAAQPTMALICNVFDPATQQGYIRDPRTIAKNAERYLQESGIGDIAYFGPEPEFFVFDDVRFKSDPNESFYKLDSIESPHNSATEYDVGNMGHRPDFKGGYMPVAPVDTLSDLRAEIAKVLQIVGVKPTLHHHEVAASQCEVGIMYDTLTNSADNIQKLKYVAKNVAASYGKSVTFMPKPIYGDNGSGMHVHQSIWKQGKTLFYQAGTYADLSELCLYYIGGIIKHGKAINAFSNPTTNSYKRLVPGYEAPTHLAYSARNRSASVRIPYSESAPAKRIETRFPDPASNPYLTFAALMMAGLDGIKNKIHPGEPQDGNLYELTAVEAQEIPAVAACLYEALDALDKDRAFLKAGGVFTDEMINAYIELKRAEAVEASQHPTPLEFKRYYSC